MFSGPDTRVAHLPHPIEHGGLVNSNGTWAPSSLHAVFKVHLPQLWCSSKRGIVLAMAGAIKALLSIQNKYIITPHLSNSPTVIIFNSLEDSHDPESVKGISEAYKGHEPPVFYSTREYE